MKTGIGRNSGVIASRRWGETDGEERWMINGRTGVAVFQSLRMANETKSSDVSDPEKPRKVP